MDDLIKLSDSLAQEIGCNQQVGILFVLTGLAPIVAPISARARLRRHLGLYTYNRGTITMKIEPWVSAESVLKAYRQFQKRLFGRSYRPMRSQRMLELFRFVTQEMIIDNNSEMRWNDSVTRTKWSELMERWNRSHSYQYTQVTNIARDYKRARQFIVFPSYKAIR